MSETVVGSIVPLPSSDDVVDGAMARGVYRDSLLFAADNARLRAALEQLHADAFTTPPAKWRERIEAVLRGEE